MITGLQSFVGNIWILHAGLLSADNISITLVSPSDVLVAGGGVVPCTLLQLWPELRETWSQLRIPSSGARKSCTGAAGATLGPGLVRVYLGSDIAPCATRCSDQ